MASIQFGGLASGLDTGTIVSELMKLERLPIDRLERDKTYHNNRLKALTDFNGKLTSFLDKIEDLNSASNILAKSVGQSRDDFFSASVSSTAQTGSYDIEVVQLAQMEKEYSQGFSTKYDQTFGTGTITLTVGANAPVDVTVDSDNNSLAGIMDAINAADAGVKATIVNDGDPSAPFRLVLSADKAGETFTASASLAGGTDNAITLTQHQAGLRSHIIVDGIDVYGDSNSLNGVIEGVTLDLLKPRAAVGEKTTINVGVDEQGVKDKIKGFVDAYNEIFKFIGEQKTASWSNDSIFRSIPRGLQSLLTTSVATNGSSLSLAGIGLKTERDGSLAIDDGDLSDAIQNDVSGMVKMLVGDDSAEGIITRFQNYLDQATDTYDGFLAGRKTSIDGTVKRIDKSIELMEVRMEQKQRILEAQFSALEQMMSGLNAQGSYLTQQMSSISNIWSRRS